MKRFHVHVAVNDLAASVTFYSKLFGQAPSKQQADYAKWMLEDPSLNFAISARGQAVGVNHFGMQADSSEELKSLITLADAASDGETLDQHQVACCYANSEKHWTVDPQGLAWEHFLTTSDETTFGEDAATPADACCIPLRPSQTSAPEKPEPCCIPQAAVQGQAQCCD